MEAKGGAGGGIRGEGESEWLSSGIGRQGKEEKSGAVERRNKSVKCQVSSGRRREGKEDKRGGGER